MDADVFELAVQTTVWKMMLEKVSGCVLIAIWLLAMAAESGIEVQFNLIAGVLQNDPINVNE